MAEQQAENLKVVGSIPTLGTSVLTSPNVAKYLRDYIAKREKAWRLRLVPHNAKDAWRGPMPRLGGVKRRSWSSIADCLYFVCRDRRLQGGVEKTLYTLRLY